MSTPTRKAEPMTTLRDRITVTLARRGFTPYDPAEDPRRTSFLVEEEGPGATVTFVWDRATDAHRAIALEGYEGVLTANGFAVESRADCLYVNGGRGDRAMNDADFSGWTIERLLAQRKHLQSILLVSVGQSDRVQIREEYDAVCAEIAKRSKEG